MLKWAAYLVQMVITCLADEAMTCSDDVEMIGPPAGEYRN